MGSFSTIALGPRHQKQISHHTRFFSLDSLQIKHLQLLQWAPSIRKGRECKADRHCDGQGFMAWDVRDLCPSRVISNPLKGALTAAWITVQEVP